MVFNITRIRRLAAEAELYTKYAHRALGTKCQAQRSVSDTVFSFEYRGCFA